MNRAAERDSTEHDQPAADGLVELYRTQRDDMVRLAHLLTGANLVAQDLVQDAFVKLGPKWAELDNPGGYLRRMVVNECRMWLRHGQVEQRHQRAEREPVQLPPELDEMWTALAALPERQRVALVCRYYEDLTVDEIAVVLDCRPGTVKSLIHRGLASLREVIDDAH